MIASVPYRTFPSIPLGPFELHTFGLFVALGVLAGSALAVRLMPPGVDREQTARLITRMVVIGVAGARLTWAVTHLASLDNPLEVVAIWQGGLQFSGGFLAAVAVVAPTMRRWPAALRLQVLDRFAVGLALGLAIGRVGCYAVGEHLGHRSSFFLATRYLGGDTREGPLQVGVAVHNTALYEMLHLLILAALLFWLMARSGDDTTPGLALSIFCLWYGAARFATDMLRAYDSRFAGLTGAQWLCLALLATGGLIFPRRGRAPVPLDTAG